MALMLKNGAIFLHIPKTGGNWVATVLQGLDLIDGRTPHKHADIDHFSHVPRAAGSTLGRIVRSIRYSVSHKPFMFCFVRNPLDWYESWFRYMAQPSRRWRQWGDAHDVNNWHPNAMLNGLGSDDFNQFIRNVLRHRPGFVTEMYGWYARPQVDFVGRQEHLVDDLIAVLRQMNLRIDEDYIRSSEKVGVSPIPEKPIAWDAELRRETILCEYAGLQRYGYQASLVGLAGGAVPPPTEQVTQGLRLAA